MSDVEDLRVRIIQLENHVAALERFVGLDPSAVAPVPAQQPGPPPIPPPVRELAADNPIRAIKELRAQWAGLSLAEAKHIIDDVRAGRR